MNELKGNETDRILKFLAILNTLLEEKKEGRIIIVGGFAAELYSGRAYRTMDVDIIIEGNQELVKSLLERISDRGLRVYLPKIKEISDKAIDVVSNVYNGGKKQPIKIIVDEKYHVYVIPPEEIILTYLSAWKFWESIEDRNKAVLIFCSQKELLDMNYIEEEATKRNVKDFLIKLQEYC